MEKFLQYGPISDCWADTIRAGVNLSMELNDGHVSTEHVALLRGYAQKSRQRHHDAALLEKWDKQYEAAVKKAQGERESQTG